MAGTKLYRMLHGKHSGRDESGKVVDYTVGDDVPLTDTQYEAFKDKFEAPKEKKPAELKTATKPDEPVTKV